MIGTSQDWLLAAVEKSRAVDVDDDVEVCALQPDEHIASTEQRRKRCRVPEQRGPNDTSSDGDVPPEVDNHDFSLMAEGDLVVEVGDHDAATVDDDEITVTRRNLDLIMRTNPNLLPRYVVEQRRRRLDDRDITVFEAEHHYTMAELRAFARTAGLDLSRYKGTGRKAGLAVAVVAAVSAQAEEKSL
jgi:hypothetical protein